MVSDQWLVVSGAEQKTGRREDWKEGRDVKRGSGTAREKEERECL